MGESGFQIPVLRVYKKNRGAVRLQAMEGLPRDDFQGFVQVLVGGDCRADIEDSRLQAFNMQQRRGFLTIFMSESNLWRLAQVFTKNHSIRPPLPVYWLHNNFPAGYPPMSCGICRCLAYSSNPGGFPFSNGDPLE